LNNRKQEEVADVDLAEEEYHQLEKMERKFKDWLMADVWTSAFFIEKTELDQTFTLPMLLLKICVKTNP
jgi:hypothetical protein